MVLVYLVYIENHWDRQNIIWFSIPKGYLGRRGCEGTSDFYLTLDTCIIHMPFLRPSVSSSRF
jgi:hypothetical protein